MSTFLPLALNMWHGLFPYYLCGSVVYFIVPFLDLWLFCGRWFGPIDRSQSSGHVGSSNTSTSTPARLEYSSSFLKSIGKAQPKSIIPSYLWNRLEDLGIRKRFRSRRGGHRSRHRSGYPAAQATGLLSFNTGVALPAPGQETRESITVPWLLICNARSFAPKIDELQCIVANNEVDIVCVSETWLSDEIPDPPLLNYVFYRRDRTYTSGGGVAVYVNCKIGSCRLDAPDLDGISESLWVQLRPTRLPRGISSILLGIIYHPPSASAEDNAKLYEHVNTMVDSYTLRHPECLVLVTGDFNPTSTNIAPTPFKRSCGLTQIINVLTRDSLRNFGLVSNQQTKGPLCP